MAGAFTSHEFGLLIQYYLHNLTTNTLKVLQLIFRGFINLKLIYIKLKKVLLSQVLHGRCQLVP